MIVLHYTAMASADEALERLCDPVAEVSAHYLIARTGEVLQLVDEAERAWHAGAGSWGGQGDVNSRSIGIELDNDGFSPFPAPLMTSLEGLLPGIMERCSIRAEGVIAHSDMAPTRKCDPGRRFDWLRLARQGLAVWPNEPMASGAADANAFLGQASQFGYDVTLPLDQVLDAFRQRFRPFAHGPLTGADTEAITDLAARFPVDRARLSA